MPVHIGEYQLHILGDLYCISTVQDYGHNLSKLVAREVIVLKGEPILSSNGHIIKLHPKHLCFYLYICATLKLDQRSFLLHWVVVNKHIYYCLN